MQEERGGRCEEVTRSFILTRDIFGLDALWLEVDALDNRVPAALQYAIPPGMGRLVVRDSLWFLRRRREKLPIGKVLDIFRPALAALAARLPDILCASDRMAWSASVERLASKGVPIELARRLANLEALYGVLDVTEVSVEQKRASEAIAALYYALRGELELRWISEKISQLPTDTSWQAPARHPPRGAPPRPPPTPTSPRGPASPPAGGPRERRGPPQQRAAP